MYVRVLGQILHKKLVVVLDILKPEGGEFAISINLGGRLDICRKQKGVIEGILC